MTAPLIIMIAAGWLAASLLVALVIGACLRDGARPVRSATVWRADRLASVARADVADRAVTREQPLAQVIDFPPRLRAVRDAWDEAGRLVAEDPDGAVVFDWPRDAA